jgi:hypothetical protein
MHSFLKHRGIPHPHRVELSNNKASVLPFTTRNGDNRDPVSGSVRLVFVRSKSSESSILSQCEGRLKKLLVIV